MYIEESWSANDYRYYLAHHGIRGQRWGEKNGPPYPLDLQSHSKSEKDAHWKSSLTKAKTNKGVSTKSDGTTDETHLNYERAKKKLVSDRSWIFDNQKDKDIIETFEDGTQQYPPVARAIGDELSREDWCRNNDVEYHNSLPFDIHCEKGFDGVYDKVNPDYGNPGTTNNCPFVGAAMQLRGMGFNVVARRSLGGVSATSFEDWFKGAKTEYCDSWEEMKQDILSDGDGSSGVLQGYYGSGLGSGMGGHTLHWRNENGKIIVADGQNHTEHSFDTFVDEYGFGAKGCFRTRLDNTKPDWYKLSEDGVVGADTVDRRWRISGQTNVYDKF